MALLLLVAAAAADGGGSGSAAGPAADAAHAPRRSWTAFADACGFTASLREAPSAYAAACEAFSASPVTWTGVISDVRAVREASNNGTAQAEQVQEYTLLYVVMAPSYAPWGADVVLRADAALTARYGLLAAPVVVGAELTFVATMRRRKLFGIPPHEFELSDVLVPPGSGDRASWRVFLAACGWARRLLSDAVCRAKFDADFRGFSVYWRGVVSDVGADWVTVRMVPRDAWLRSHDVLLTWAAAAAAAGSAPAGAVADVSRGDTVSFRGTLEALGHVLIGAHTVALRHLQREAAAAAGGGGGYADDEDAAAGEL